MLFKPDSNNDRALEALIQDLDNLVAQHMIEITPYKDLENNYNTFYSLIKT